MWTTNIWDGEDGCAGAGTGAVRPDRESYGELYAIQAWEECAENLTDPRVGPRGGNGRYETFDWQVDLNFMICFH